MAQDKLDPDTVVAPRLREAGLTMGWFGRSETLKSGAGAASQRAENPSEKPEKPDAEQPSFLEEVGGMFGLGGTITVFCSSPEGEQGC